MWDNDCSSFKFHTRQSYHFLLFFISSYLLPNTSLHSKNLHTDFSPPQIFSISNLVSILAWGPWSYHLQVVTPTLISATHMTIPQILSSSCFTSGIWNTCTTSLTIGISMQVSLHLFFVHKRNPSCSYFSPTLYLICSVVVVWNEVSLCSPRWPETQRSVSASWHQD